MISLLSAADGTALPINAVGWTVTVLGLLFVVAWLAYLYR
jgi:hypothetical protein